MAKKKAAWLGLGVMGYPMAGHLVDKADLDLVVYNRTPAKLEKWCATHPGQAAHTPAAAAAEADYVFACVGNDDDLRAVTNGRDGAFSTMKPGAIFIDHTTVSAAVTRDLSDIAQTKGISFIDAPVSGGQAGAEKGTLTIMCGGDETAFKTAEPLLASYSQMCKLLGPSGSGQLAKMCNQIAIAGLVQGLAEALHFGEKAGLDMAEVIPVIVKGAAGSWQMENRYKTMLANKFDFGFAVDWMRKDLAICLDMARKSGASIPVAGLVDQFYAEVQAMGGKRWDTSSLIARLNRDSKKG